MSSMKERTLSRMLNLCKTAISCLALLLKREDSSGILTILSTQSPIDRKTFLGKGAGKILSEQKDAFVKSSNVNSSGKKQVKRCAKMYKENRKVFSLNLK